MGERIKSLKVIPAFAGIQNYKSLSAILGILDYFIFNIFNDII
ncbi:MAG: hypothetical protein ACYCTB_02760 [bacterium]